jgi:hypothetical protein
LDAEDPPGLVAPVFGQVQVERWDAPLVRLPGPRHGPRLRDRTVRGTRGAVAAPERVTTPVTITKRGSVIHARK